MITEEKTEPERREPDYERFPYSGYAEHEEWVRSGGSIVDGKRWVWL